MNEPKVSFLIPALDAASYIGDCLRSLLRQRYGNFEIVIVNDGSRDNTDTICEDYRKKSDKKISIVTNRTNTGLPSALNKGMDYCDGEYIARMDSDDISEPDRLAVQVAYLQQNPDVGILGTSRRIMGSGKIHNPAVDPSEGRERIFFENFIAHPTVMMRRETLVRNKLRYDETFILGEDYDLWLRASLCTKLASIETAVLSYREHDGQQSRTKLRVMAEGARRARKRAFLLGGFLLNERDLQIMDAFSLEGGTLRNIEKSEALRLAVVPAVREQKAFSVRENHLGTS